MNAVMEAGIAKIVNLEKEIGQLPQVDMPPKHYFAQGVYAREITIPAGVVLVGRIHKHSQINIISKGDISVMTEDGLRRVQAPCTIVSPAGVKRVGYAHEETVWTTILGTDETDPDTIESTLTAGTFADYKLFCQTQLGPPKPEGD